MLLNNESGSVVMRRSRNDSRSAVRDPRASSPGRNSWLVNANLDDHHHHVAQYHHAVMTTDVNKNATSTSSSDVIANATRSRLRQRSVSNLTSGMIRSRDQSWGKQQGTVCKGVDYIRVRTTTAEGTTAADRPVIDGAAGDDAINDRSQYGNPDGQSAHSTAERAAAAVAAAGGAAVVVVVDDNHAAKDSSAGADMCRVINQNMSNDFKVTRRDTTTSATTPARAAAAAAAREAARFSANPVKTEWTFVQPSAVELQRENSIHAEVSKQ